MRPDLRVRDADVKQIPPILEAPKSMGVRFIRDGGSDSNDELRAYNERWHHYK